MWTFFILHWEPVIILKFCSKVSTCDINGVLIYNAGVEIASTSGRFFRIILPTYHTYTVPNFLPDGRSHFSLNFQASLVTILIIHKSSLTTPCIDSIMTPVIHCISNGTLSSLEVLINYKTRKT